MSTSGSVNARTTADRIGRRQIESVLQPHCERLEVRAVVAARAARGRSPMRRSARTIP